MITPSNIRRTTLNVEMFGVIQPITLELSIDPRAMDKYKDMAVMRLTTKFATTGVVTIKKLVPLNSFEHFKLEYFPKFLISKFPVKYKELKFDCREIFPQYSHLIKDQCTRYLDVTTIG